MPDSSRSVSRSAVVSASAADLFALVANPYRHHEFDGSGTVQPHVSGPERLATGDTFRVGMRMFGIPYTMTSTATRVEPGRVVEWQVGAGQRWRYEFEPLDAGRTRVIETFDYAESRMGRLFEWLGVVRRNAQGMERTLENLGRLFG